MFSKFYVVKQRIKNVKGHYFWMHDDFWKSLAVTTAIIFMESRRFKQISIVAQVCPLCFGNK